MDLSHWSPTGEKFIEKTVNDKYNNDALKDIKHTYQTIIDTHKPTTISDLLKLSRYLVLQKQEVYPRFIETTTQIESDSTPILSLSDFNDDQLLAELHRRGFSGELTYLKNSLDITNNGMRTEKKNTVYILYTTDVWHSLASRTLEAVCTSKSKAIKIAKEISKRLFNNPLDENDIECLNLYDQTQGRSTNFQIEETQINTILNSL